MRRLRDSMPSAGAEVTVGVDDLAEGGQSMRADGAVPAGGLVVVNGITPTLAGSGRWREERHSSGWCPPVAFHS